MKKWITPLVLLMTVALLVGLAFLPALVGAIRDAGAANTPGSASVHSLALDMGEKTASLTIPQKMTAMLCGEVSNIVPALASMTESQVQEAVLEGLKPYMEVAFLPRWQHVDLQCQPMIAVSWQDPNHYLLFWSVTLTAVGEDYSKHLLILQVDDETGLILSMDYMGLKPEPTVNGAQLVESLAQIWLAQNGIEDAAPVTAVGQSVGTSNFAKCVYYLKDESSPLYVYFLAENDGTFGMWFSIMPE